MRRIKRRARVASLCLWGKTAISVRQNLVRAELLLAVIEQVAGEGWAPVDALVLPGGYFRAAGFIGHLTHGQRCRSLMGEGFGSALAQASRRLERVTSKAALVVGIDSGAPNSSERGDETCVGLVGGRIVGLARKIFPAAPDVHEDFLPIVPNLADYGSEHRFVQLPNGQQTLLAACYDLFGLVDVATGADSHSRETRYLWADGRYYEGRRVKPLREAGITIWHALVRRQRPEIGLCAIHRFKRPGMDGFWQRHGIAAGSAALQGGLTVGAAHFESQLPEPERSTLSAIRVPRPHLKAGTYRKAHRLKPLAAIYVTHGRLTALVRLFEA